ncbi:MAG: hypothetical protein Q9168_007820 [Polycauliona sp. 1 TL-2023]
MDETSSKHFIIVGDESSVDLTEIDNTWKSKVLKSYFRRSQALKRNMGTPKTPSPDFTLIKDAVIRAIQPYDNFEEIDYQDKFAAMSYNMCYSHLMAREWKPCEGIAQLLRFTCLDPKPANENSSRVLSNLSFWRATLFFKVTLLRMMMFPIRWAASTIQSVTDHRLGKDLTTRVLAHIYGNAIPYPFLKPDFMRTFLWEESTRMYLLRVERNGGRSVRDVWIVPVALDVITWMTLDTDNTICPHNVAILQEVPVEKFYCGVCGKTQSGLKLSLIADALATCKTRPITALAQLVRSHAIPAPMAEPDQNVVRQRAQYREDLPPHPILAPAPDAPPPLLPPAPPQQEVIPNPPNPQNEHPHDEEDPFAWQILYLLLNALLLFWEAFGLRNQIPGLIRLLLVAETKKQFFILFMDSTRMMRTVWKVGRLVYRLGTLLYRCFKMFWEIVRFVAQG